LVAQKAVQLQPGRQCQFGIVGDGVALTASLMSVVDERRADGVALNVSR
jgi:hypothetical protein